MSLSARILSLVDVLLRVPPLFVIDELFRMGLGLPQGSPGAPDGLPEEPYKQQAAKHIFQYDAQFYKLFFSVLIKFVLSCLGKCKFSPSGNFWVIVCMIGTTEQTRTQVEMYR